MFARVASALGTGLTFRLGQRFQDTPMTRRYNMVSHTGSSLVSRYYYVIDLTSEFLCQPMVQLDRSALPQPSMWCDYQVEIYFTSGGAAPTPRRARKLTGGISCHMQSFHRARAL